MTAFRKCPHCAALKPNALFNKNRNNKNGLATYCRACEWEARKNHTPTPERKREETLKRRYGITHEIYNAMLLAQGGMCAICKTNRLVRSGAKHAPIDHDHSTGRTRAILCSPCNTMIGCSHENVSTLRAAIEYLEFHMDMARKTG